MANFPTHISASTLLGVGYGTVAHFQFGVPIGHCFIAGGLCSIAGVLPDLDHKSGIPLREMLCFVSILIPMLMLRRFEEIGLTPEQILFTSAVLYVGIRFVGGELFRKFTKHRGMWHSIPAAIAAGMITYIVCLSPEENIRIMKAWAVVLGFILHLVLDEIYSVDLMGARLRKSSGTALKFFGKDMGPNVIVYANIILLSGFIVSDGMLMECCRDANATHAKKEAEDSSPLGQQVGERVNRFLDRFEGRTKDFVNRAFDSNANSASNASFETVPGGTVPGTNASFNQSTGGFNQNTQQPFRR